MKVKLKILECVNLSFSSVNLSCSIPAEVCTVWCLKNTFLGRSHLMFGSVYILVVNSAIGCFKFSSQSSYFKQTFNSEWL